MSEPTKECQRVEERIAEILQAASSDSAELAATDQALLDHIADCERCRDARFEAEQSAELAALAGHDYVHPEDFEARLLAALESAGRDLEPGAAETEQVSVEPTTELESAAVARELEPEPPKPAPASGGAAGSNVVRLPSRKTIALISGAVAVAAVAVLMGRSKGPSDQAEHAVAGAWQGVVKQVQRGYGSDQGLVACVDSDCRALKTGDAVRVGEAVKTDGLTRVLLDLADGSVVALNRSTELQLRAEAERSARLVQGEIIAEVQKEVGKVAIVDLPQGQAVVVGTKFALQALSSSSGVDVSRGEVRLVDRQHRSVSIRAGEAGRISEDAPPSAAALTSLSESFEWGERAFLDEEEKVATTRGLGELRAMKPGEKNERAGAVTLSKHSVKVRVVDSLARTEVEEVFQNHTDDVLEGIFRFPLPADAKIERLALEVDGRMEEGAFVDRERAAAIWRGAIVNSRQKILQPLQQQEIVWVPGPWKDPALLEWQRGGRFELRIFPIPKRGSRRIILAYTQTIKPSGSVRRYSYPLAHDPSGSTRVADFRVDVQVRGHEGSVRVQGYDLNRVASEAGVEKLALEQQGFVPHGDLGLEFSLPENKAELNIWAYKPNQLDVARGAADSELTGVAAPEDRFDALQVVRPTQLSAGSDASYVALALRPKLPRWENDRRRAYVLAVDTSRSMFGEQYRRATALTRRIIAEMDRGDVVTVLACHAECEPVLDELVAPSPALAERVYAALSREQPEGASDLVKTIEEASKWAGRAAGRDTRIVLIGDGASTVGPVQPAFVRRAVKQVLPNDVMVSAVTVGSDADLGALSAATEAGGGSVLLYAPGQSVSEAAFDVLAATYGRALRNARVELPPELVDVAPKQLGAIPAGGEVLIVARMRGERLEGKVVLTGLVGEREFEQDYEIEVVATSNQGNAFVPRLFAAAQIAELERASNVESRQRIVDLSKQFNVASRYTSLLVLESPAMFKAFGLDNQRSVPLWTGEEESTSTSGEGNVAVDSESRADWGGLKDKDSALGNTSGGGLGTRQPRDDAARRGSDAPASAAPRAELSEGDLWAPPPPSRPNVPAKAKKSDDFESERSRPVPRWEEERQWIPMRQVWTRVGNISFPPQEISAASSSELSRLEARVRQNPLSRDALQALYGGYMLAGNLDGASELAEQWSEKDPMDADALTARADVAAQRGDRALAIRILGSVVDIRPDEHKAQWRLARLHRWAGRAEQGCRHSTAIAQIRVTDSKLLADALRCTRDTGQQRLMDELRSAARADTLQVAERLLSKDEDDSQLSGDFKLEAEWDGAQHDLDLVLVHPDGYRVSWLGAPTQAVITAQDVSSVHREGLALRGAKLGEYAVEVVRSVGGSGPVRGNLRLSIGKKSRSVPFILEGDQVRIATVRLSMTSQLVPF